MRVRWAIAILCVFVFIIAPLQALEWVYISGGEVDGIRVEAFYLSKKVITNQDYFNFIQEDGYRKKFLWDAEALKNFDRFKNSKNQYAPRSWQGGSPPEGQEYQSVFGISMAEARAYSKNIGWQVPTKMMWKRAQQAPEGKSLNIGPYPWKNTSGDNIYAIRIVRYYSSAEIFGNLKEELTKLTQTSAKIRSVNANSSKIRSLYARVDKIDEDFSDVKTQVTTLEKKIPKQKIQNLEQSLNNVQKQIKFVENKQKNLESKQITEKELHYASLKKLQKDILGNGQTARSAQESCNDLKTEIVSLQKRVSSNEGNQKNLATKVKALENKLSRWEKKLDKISKLEANLEKLVAQISAMNKKQAIVEEQVVNLQSSQKNLHEKYKKLGLEQEQNLSKNLAKIQKQVEKLEEFGPRIERLNKSIEVFTVRCPVLPQNVSYLQYINDTKEQQTKQLQNMDQNLKDKNTSLERGLASVRARSFQTVRRLNNLDNNFQEINQSISSLKKQDTTINTELENLRKQDALFSKEHTSLRDNLANLGKCDTKLEKDIAQLYKLSVRIEGYAKELNAKIKECKTVDTEQSRRSDNLEKEIKESQEKITQVQGLGVKLKKEIQSLNANDTHLEKKSFDLEAKLTIKINETRKKNDDLGNKIDALEIKFQNEVKDFKNTTEMAQREIDKELRVEISKVTTKLSEVRSTVNVNQADIASLQKKQESGDINLTNAFKILRKRTNTLEESFLKLKMELRLGSDKLQNALNDVGNKFLELCRQGIVIAPTPKKSDGKTTQTPNVIDEKWFKKFHSEFASLKGKLGHLENSVGEVKQKLGKLEQQPKNGINNKALAETFYRLGNTYYRHGTRKAISLDLLHLALDYDASYVKARRLLREVQFARFDEPKTKADQKAPERKIQFVHVNQSSFSGLCYSLGQIYFDHSEPKLAAACMKLALEYDRKSQAKKFIQKNLGALNCPKNMVFIPGAKLKIGRVGDPDFPSRTVDIKSFYMDRYEVTRGEFHKFVASGEYLNKKHWSEEGWQWLEKSRRRFSRKAPFGWNTPKGDQKNLPVTNVNFYEAEAYAKFVGKRLPTPEEWEYAARGKDGRKFPWGNMSPFDGNEFRANYRQIGIYQDKFVGIAPVKQFAKDISPFEIYGLAGNVAEWCAGGYKNFEDGKQMIREKYRPIKGGSFKDISWFRMQAFSSVAHTPEEGLKDVGFRCAKSLE